MIADFHQECPEFLSSKKTVLLKTATLDLIRHYIFCNKLLKIRSIFALMKRHA